MYQTFNIFPTTVYVGEMEDHSKHKEDFYKVYSKYDYAPVIHKNGYEYHTTTSENFGNPLIHLDKNLEFLFSDIVSHTQKYVYDVLEYKKIFDFIITKTWLSRARKSTDETKWHGHAPSHASFIYYLNTPPNSHTLNFLTPHNSNSLFAGNNTSDYKHGIETFNEVNSSTFFLEPKEGTIVIFPSTIRHRTSSTSSNFEGERLAIVGDIVLVYNDEILDYSQGYINPKHWKIYSS